MNEDQKSQKIADITKKIGIERLSIPYFLDHAKDYSFSVLRDIESAINIFSGPLELESHPLISQEEIEQLKEDTIRNIYSHHQKRRITRISLLNGANCRDREKLMMSFVCFLKRESGILESLYSDFSVTRESELNKTIREFKSFFGGINVIRVKPFRYVHHQIFANSKIPIIPTKEIKDYSYVDAAIYSKFECKIKEINEKSSATIKNLNSILEDYLTAFKDHRKDIRSDHFLKIDISGAGIRLLDESSFRRIKERLDIIEKNEKNNEIIKFLRFKTNSNVVKLGGNTFLYYIRVNYGARKKPFYKIGITSRTLKERYPRSDYDKISKILFCERVENAAEIEKIIIKMFCEHAIPLDFFRDAQGKTEFFDYDVLGLDH
jgi:hypothetical protein